MTREVLSDLELNRHSRFQTLEAARPQRVLRAENLGAIHAQALHDPQYHARWNGAEKHLASFDFLNHLKSLLPSIGLS
jgi:hypothetical protein